MAFDQPLEADKVDDLNLFSAFVRAPIIGTLMWILGGEHAKRVNEDEEDASEGAENGRLDDDDGGANSNTPPPQYYCKRPKSALKKQPPSLAGSELSDIGEVFQEMDLYDSSRYGLGKRKKELSWSDESGQDLAQVMDEQILSGLTQSSFRYTMGNQQTTRFELKPSSSSEERGPNRSTMTRSRSVRAHMEPSEKNYLPGGMDRQSNSFGLTNPYGMNDRSASGGGESPLWGWYVRTTPPTPEMYSRSPKKSTSSGDTSTASTSSNLTEGSVDLLPPSSHCNPVFQGMQTRNRDTPMGFPSVPL